MSDMSRYVRWWQENPDKARDIKARRRIRYATDTALRDKKSKKNKIYYLRKRIKELEDLLAKARGLGEAVVNQEEIRSLEKEIQTRRGALEELTRGTRRYPKPRLMDINGEMIELWSIGRVADYLGLAKRTLANYEARNMIPVNRRTDSNGRRWWPAPYVKWIKPMVDSRLSGEISAQEFSERVWEGWQTAKFHLPIVSEDVYERYSEGPRHTPEPDRGSDGDSGQEDGQEEHGSRED